MLDSLVNGTTQVEAIDLEKLTRIASELNNGIQCVALDSLTRVGSKNIIIFLAFDDEVSTRWVARFPLLGHHGKDNTYLGEAIESMAVTMQYVSDHTSIPIPKIYHWDGTSANELGRPYVIMEAVKGNSLLELERSGSGIGIMTRALPAFIDQWAQYTAELAALQFDRIGSLRWDDFGNVILDKLSSRTARLLTGCKLQNQLQGPFHSVPEYLLSTSELKMLAIAASAQSSADLQAHFLRSKLVESLLPYYLDNELAKGPFILTHGHLDLQHILVDESRGYNITGIIDWDYAAVLPPQSHLCIPEMLNCDLWASHKQQLRGISSWHIEFAWNNRDLYKSCLLKHLQNVNLDFGVDKLLEESRLYGVLERSISEIPQISDLDLLWGKVYGELFSWKDAIKAMEKADWGMAMADRMSLHSADDKREVEEHPESNEARATISSPSANGNPMLVAKTQKETWSKRVGYKIRWGWWHAEQILLCHMGTHRVSVLMRSTSPSEQRYLSSKTYEGDLSEHAIKKP